MEHVLVTGACGLVGRAVVRKMLAQGWQVTASDLDTEGNRKAVGEYDATPAFRTRWADLTAPGDVAGLLAETAPDVVVHLAAVIPPACYASPRIARAVTVDGTRHLVEAAERVARPPRLVQASSVAVYGSRNPHRVGGPVTAETPMAPSDLYGQLKAESEEIVRASALDWVVLRLGAVVTVERHDIDSETHYFSSLLPDDGRIQTVDVRDVATAFEAASREPVVGSTFLIGGDDASHRRLQRDLAEGIGGAMGLEGAFPKGRDGDPDNDASWFATDWMDTTDAQARLRFQDHSWDDVLAEVRRRTGRKRYLMRLLAPILHAVFERRSPYRDAPGRYSDVWAGIEAKWGNAGVHAGR